MWIGKKLGILAVLTGSFYVVAAQSQDAPTSDSTMGPVKSARFRTTFVTLGADNYNGVLYEPQTPGPNARIALVYSYPRDFNISRLPATEMVNRGYRVLMAPRHGGLAMSPTDGLAEFSRGITYMRTLPGVQRVVAMAHSDGGRVLAFYANVAEHGPAACQGPEVIYPCKTEEVAGLAKPDGIVLMDPVVGAAETPSSVDPAYDDNDRRTRAELDMYAATNGYDAKTGSATYSADFMKRFYAEQSARNMRIVNNAIARLKLIEQGKGTFTDDEPLVIPGAINGGGNGISLYHTNLALQSHTKKPHTLLKADGSTPNVIVQSVRPATGAQDSRMVGALARGAALNTTVRTFLANFAMRTTKDFALSADDWTGVDWKSSARSAPAAAQGITVPTLVLTMSCNFLVVSGEIIYDHVAAKDKTYASVEGALHGFTPCKPEYGDTTKRSFDFIDSWLAKPGRF